MTDFDQKLEFGNEGEKRIQRKLCLSGCAVIPVWQFLDNKSAPTIFTAERKIVLPDLQVWCEKHGQYFGECKRKKCWVHWDGRRETGCDLTSYRHYMQVQSKTRVPLRFFFTHEVESPCGVFTGLLDDLAPTVRIWDGRNKGVRKHTPMAFFDAKRLTLAWTLDQIGAGS